MRSSIHAKKRSNLHIIVAKAFKKNFSILFDPLKKSYFYDEKKGF